MQEEWKDIVEYEGLYQISSYGRVKSLKRKYSPKEKILNLYVTNNGYQTTHLYKNGHMVTKLIHRLVAEAFVENSDPSTKVEVNHIDGNKINNNYQNLEWVTSSYNHKHAYANGLMATTDKAKKARGESCKKFNIQKSQMIYQLHPDTKAIEKIWMSKTNAADNLGISLHGINYRIKKQMKNVTKYDFAKVVKPQDGFLIIVEGSDCSGKSTFINKLSKDLNIPVLKGSDFSIAEKGTDYMFNYMKKQYETNDYVILDRSFISNLVYAPLFDKNILDLEQIQILSNIVNKKSLVVYLKGDYEIIKERLEKRGDEYISESHVRDILQQYDHVIDSLKSKIDILEFNIKEYNADDLMKIIPNICKRAGIINK